MVPNFDTEHWDREKILDWVIGDQPLDDQQLALLQSLYSLNSLSVRFTDNFGNRTTKTMYCGPLTKKSAFKDATTLKIVLSTDIAMNFIEV